MGRWLKNLTLEEKQAEMLRRVLQRRSRKASAQRLFNKTAKGREYNKQALKKRRAIRRESFARIKREVTAPVPSTLIFDERYYAVIRKLGQTKKGAKDRGLLFNIDVDDLYPLPTHCRYLGIELSYIGGDGSNNASIDRIDSTQGYIPGNVMIISWRANMLKSNGTIEEHERIAKVMREDKYTSKCEAPEYQSSSTRLGNILALVGADSHYKQLN